jgi:hypothetical protein
VDRCVAYNNGLHGFNITGSSAVVTNCIAEDNSGYGFTTGSQLVIIMINNAAYSNTSGQFNIGAGAAVQQIGSITGTSSFFVDAANDDYAINDTAGAGADLRGVAYPETLLGGALSYGDIGAAQSGIGAPGGGGGLIVHPGLAGRLQ